MNKVTYCRKKPFLVSILTLLAISLLTSVSFADIFTGGRSSAIFSAYYDGSVASYGYTTHYDTARTSWNGISSKVNISKTTSLAGTPDKYYVGTTAVSGLLGQIIPYKLSGGTYIPATTSETWAYSTVAIYHNQMEAFNMTRAERTSNAAHEIGHTVSLAHPGILIIAPSVMRQGIQSILPQGYDHHELKRKWGN